MSASADGGLILASADDPQRTLAIPKFEERGAWKPVAHAAYYPFIDVLNRQLHTRFNKRKRDGAQIRREESAWWTHIDCSDGLFAIGSRKGHGVDYSIAKTASRPPKVANPLYLVCAAVDFREFFEVSNGLPES